MSSLPTRALGRSSLNLTTIGLGTWAMGGGGWTFAWGDQDDNESIRAIQAGLDAGINWIDTAAVYGLGNAERVVGQAIKGRRDSVIVATKCGRVWDESTRAIGKREDDVVPAGGSSATASGQSRGDDRRGAPDARPDPVEVARVEGRSQ